MTEDITSLQIRILYDSVTEAERRLRELERTGRRAGDGMRGQEKAANSLMGKLGKLALSYITLRGVIAGFKAIVKTSVEFQNLEAQLVTSTGSANKAAKAFEALSDFAARTPFDLKQTVAGFISLVNRGLTPSERALTSYGNTAASLGKDLSDVILGVANATNNNFEIVRGLGVNVKDEGDKLKLTFRGISETVGKTKKEIEGYFIRLGEKDGIAGGMERLSETLGGAFNNLGDDWEKLKALIGKEGLGDVVESGVRKASELIGELQAQISSGQMQAAIDGWGKSFTFAYGEIEDALTGSADAVELFRDLVATFSSDHEKDVQSGVIDIWDDVEFRLMDVPLAFGTMAKLVKGTIDGLSSHIYNTTSGWFNKLTNASTAFHLAKADNPNTIWGDKYKRPSNAASATGGSTATGATLAAEFRVAAAKAEEERQKMLSEDWIATQARIAANWDSAFDKANTISGQQDAALDKADQLRAAYDAKAAARAKDKSDRLAEFGVDREDGQEEPKPPKPTGGGGGGGGGGGNSEWEALKESLEDQETLISESYQRRFDLIENNTREGSAYQAELEISLTEKFQEEQMKRVDILNDQPGKMFEAFALEEQIIKDSYERRKEIILNATELTEEARLDLLKNAEEKYRSESIEAALRQAAEYAALYTGVLENLSTIAGAFGKRGFAFAKGLAMAQAAIKLPEAALDGFIAGNKIGGPTVGAIFAGVAAAAVGAQIGQIASSEYSGTYATGGFIPAGKYGVAGESGPEFVQGPAMITSAASTADRLANPAGGGSKVVVSIVNNTGQPVTEKRSQQGDKDLVEFIIGQAKQGIAEDIAKGGTGIAKAIQSTYNLGRGKSA